MVSIAYKWLMVISFILYNNSNFKNADLIPHPLFISVTEIEHNQKEKTVEISCKIFTDDFEKTLRMNTKEKVDLLNPAIKSLMEKLVNGYIQKHLIVQIDSRKVAMKFIGYEQQEEGITSYFQVDNIAKIKKIQVFNNLLYEFNIQQMGIIHAIVNGNRKSSKLNNPEANALFEW
jgi:hypothetical protein